MADPRIPDAAGEHRRPARRLWWSAAAAALVALLVVALLVGGAGRGSGDGSGAGGAAGGSGSGERDVEREFRRWVDLNYGAQSAGLIRRATLGGRGPALRVVLDIRPTADVVEPAESACSWIARWIQHTDGKRAKRGIVATSQGTIATCGADGSARLAPRPQL